ncbi:MAG: CNNM domain-containing protein [Pirellulales bacterium]
MIWLSLLLLTLGLVLSAFFSGSETGFYRVPRVRLQIDAQEGNLLDRALLWLTNYPSIFVATCLTGNNLANYVMSLAIVMAAGQLFRGGLAAELIAPVVLAPILFVYGELLPKSLFFYKPHGVLRACAPMFILCAVFFAPVSILLLLISWVLERIAGQSPQKLQRHLARKELEQVLEEGHEAGILWPSQRALAQGIFAIANHPITAFSTPLEELLSVSERATTSEVLRFAREHQLSAVPVGRGGIKGKLLGYFDVADVYLDKVSPKQKMRPLLEISAEANHLSALMSLQSANEMLARLVDESGKTVGLVTVDKLYEPLFRGGN